MRRIYMAQPNSRYGNSIYFPYAAGSLIAYAFTDEIVQKEYTFGGFIYKKESFDSVLKDVRDPAVFGFSCYVWNYEYNKALAAAVKKRWPACTTVFGGHQVYRGSEIVNDINVDIIQFGEGEESFKRTLLALAGQCELCDIPNIMYHKNGVPIFSAEKLVSIPQRVSPYLNGWFDELLKTEKEVVFSAIIETNRGCPNRCAFCDWGNIKSRVRLFDESMVKSEIDWMADHKIEYVYAADANFGLFPHDGEYIDYLIQRHNETGFPKKFQATYSKNNPETIFQINKKLNDAGMSKGATLSFQSLSEDVLQSIYRKNMPLDHFKQLMQLYNKEGISAYSELILGLPGETYASFRRGLELLLENGQHMSINIFNCELLNNSIMNDPAYIEKYRIRTSRIEQHQYHVIPYTVDIQEYSNIIISTSSLPVSDWINANVLGVFMRTFHNLGLLQCFSIYLFYEKKVEYMDFYEALIRYAKQNPQSVCGGIYRWLYEKYSQIAKGFGSLTWHEEEFGELTWPLEEAAFLKSVKNFYELYQELRDFLLTFMEEDELFNDLMRYQTTIVKSTQCVGKTLSFRYDWFAYFTGIYENQKTDLQRKDVRLCFHPGSIPHDLKTFAKEVIWYGRRGGKNLVTNIEYSLSS